MTSNHVTDAAPYSAQHSRRVVVAITALALGGFAIGTTEFVTMGLLPEIARGIDESIPRTGHIISAYALGVVVGAPVIVSLAARLPRRELAVALVLALGAGNAVTALAHGYWPVMAARFVAGLPHGAYFGVASLIAASLVAPERKGRAVSGVMLGLSVATVVGVPASTWLGQGLGWRSAYWAVVAIAVV
ncbi:MAG TPA: MFS transporter, partial [Marmoricola sp.]